jgi:hypothetical protein
MLDTRVNERVITRVDVLGIQVEITHTPMPSFIIPRKKVTVDQQSCDNFLHLDIE